MLNFNLLYGKMWIVIRLAVLSIIFLSSTQILWGKRLLRQP